MERVGDLVNARDLAGKVVSASTLVVLSLATNRNARLLNFGVCATTERLKSWRWSPGLQLPRSARRFKGVTEETPLFPGCPFHRSLMQCDHV